MNKTAPLQLAAEDADDLLFLSAAVQDAVTRMGDIGFDQRARRFVIALNRLRWEAGPKDRAERARAALSIEGVLSAKVRGLPRGDSEVIVSLLSVTFEPDETPPGGVVKLVFAGDGEIVLTVECLDVLLADLGPTWRTKRVPDHKLGEEG